jgi:hypothetical protein
MCIEGAYHTGEKRARSRRPYHEAWTCTQGSTEIALEQQQAASSRPPCPDQAKPGGKTDHVTVGEKGISFAISEEGAHESPLPKEP